MLVVPVIAEWAIIHMGSSYMLFSMKLEGIHKHLLK